MKRLCTVGFIVAYLAVLAGGNVCHLLAQGTGAHPLMYYVVWDMFCGWGAYDSRLYVVGQGTDGRYYELAPGPWGAFRPWGPPARQHYDTFNCYTPRLALNALAHSRGEPLAKVMVIEECWAKKFNLPDGIWAARHDECKNVKKYYRLRSVMQPDGKVLETHDSWLAHQSAVAIAGNPRIQKQIGDTALSHDSNDD